MTIEDPAQTEHAPASDTLWVALLLAVTGGMLDAVIYQTHAHVFANAMTGNVVLMGISLIGHDWTQVGRHIGPILGFLIGVLAAKALRSVPGPRAIALGLAFEILTLATVGSLPHLFPQLLFVPIVAFASAFQTANFRTVHHVSYNSTFITGNLRDMAEGAFDSLHGALPGDQQQRGKAKATDLAAVCCGFFVGVLGGSWAASRSVDHALLAPLPLLIIVTASLLYRKS